MWENIGIVFATHADVLAVHSGTHISREILDAKGLPPLTIMSWPFARVGKLQRKIDCGNGYRAGQRPSVLGKRV